MNILTITGLSALAVSTFCGSVQATPMNVSQPSATIEVVGDGIVGLDWLRLDDMAVAKKMKFEAHTDVPELPRAGVPDLPDLGSVSGLDQWSFGTSIGKPLPESFFGDAADGPGRIFEELQGDGARTPARPGRVHTDVPDLPAFGSPGTSATPIRKPGWGDWTDGTGQRPQLESATIPTPASALVLTIGGCVVMGRRRR